MRKSNTQQVMLSRFLQRLKMANPQGGAVIERRLKQAGLAGFWGDLGASITDAIGDFATVYQDREVARIKSKEAARIAQEEAERMQTQIELERQQTENLQKQLELQRESAELSKFIRDMEFSKWQKIGLWTVGGLLLLLGARRFI